MDLSLGGRVALVAGSSRGIGRAVVERLHAEGASVVVTGRQAEHVEETARALRQSSPSRVLAVVGDLSTTSGIRRALTSTISRYQRLDIVVGCIGDGRGRPGWDQGEDAWQQAFSRNLWPAIRLCEAAIPDLGSHSGSSIILVGSITGRERLGPVAYGTAKAALAAYASRLAGEVARLGIRVACVEPGNVLVPGGRWEQRLMEEPAVIDEMLKRDVMLGRLGTPEEIADVIVFLASERASFVTAARIVVDGGQTHD